MGSLVHGLGHFSWISLPLRGLQAMPALKAVSRLDRLQILPVRYFDENLNLNEVNKMCWRSSSLVAYPCDYFRLMSGLTIASFGYYLLQSQE